MEEAKKKAFDLAQDTSKQIITLSTGILALTLTFFKDFAGGGSGASRVLMMIAWAIFLASIVTGVLHLLALTGTLASSTPSVTTGSAKLFAGIEQLSFVVALLIAVIAGALALGGSTTPAPGPLTPAPTTTTSTTTVTTTVTSTVVRPIPSATAPVAPPPGKP